MRLSPTHIQAIKETVAALLGQEADIVLFGSRTDDSARGGDVDLLITVQQMPDNIAFTAALLAAKVERALEGRRVDVVLRIADAPVQPIHEIALRTGMAL
jgi:predicted nucleotidyltransferase